MARRGKPPHMLTLYGFEGSRAIRIAWLLEELKVPYELQLFHKPDLATNSFPKNIKLYVPNGEVPALKLEDGTILSESAYIVKYIMEKYGKSSDLQPRNEHEARQVDLSLYTAEGNIMTDAVLLLIHKIAVNLAPYGASFFLKHLFGYIDSQYAVPKVHGYLTKLSEQVKDNGNYLVGGHLTAADIMYAYDLEFIFGYVGWSWDKYPVLNSYFASIEERPAYKIARKKFAGPATV